jgi:hypothetical protein
METSKFKFFIPLKFKSLYNLGNLFNKKKSMKFYKKMFHAFFKVRWVQKIEGVMFLVVSPNHFFKWTFPKHITKFIGFSFFMQCNKWGWQKNLSILFKFF